MSYYRNISLGMLNKSGINLNEYGSGSLINNFCYSMNAWQEETCINTRNKKEKEESAITKRVTKISFLT